MEYISTTFILILLVGAVSYILGFSIGRHSAYQDVDLNLNNPLTKTDTLRSEPRKDIEDLVNIVSGRGRIHEESSGKRLRKQM